MKKTLILLSFLLSLPTTFTWAADIDLNMYTSYVNKNTCSQSARNFLACAASLQVLLTSAHSEFTFKPRPENRIKSQLIFNAHSLKIFKQPVATFSQDIEASELKQLLIAKKNDEHELKNFFYQIYPVFKNEETDAISLILNYLQNNDRSTLNEEKLREAINEFFHVSQDPHSDWRAIVDLEGATKNESTEFIGLGVSFVPSAAGATLVRVVAGSGAEAAGLKTGDIILTFGTTALKGLKRPQISALAAGHEGQSLDVKYIRDRKLHSTTIVRKKIVLPVVSQQVYVFNNQKIGIIRLANFSFEDACSKIKSILQNYNQQNINKVIFDLRGNGGGALKITQCIAGLFLGLGKVISYNDGVHFSNLLMGDPKISAKIRAKKFLEQEIEQFIEEAQGNINDPEYQAYLKDLKSPKTLEDVAERFHLGDHGISQIYTEEEKVYDGQLALLIDAYSASGSELMAGAFKDLNRAVIVGQTSYGKGSIQSSGEKKGKFQFYQTTGLFYQPSGYTNQTVGIEPHIKVHRGLQASPEEEFALREKDSFLFPLQPKSIRSALLNLPVANSLSLDPKCIEAQNPSGIFKNLPNSEMKDMQVLTAMSALSCM